MGRADSIRTARPTRENIAQLIDDSAVASRSTTNIITLTTTTSTSIISVTDTDRSITVNTGDIVFVICHGSFSHSAANAVGRFLIRRDTTDLMPETQIMTPFTSADGLRTGFCVAIIDTPSAGTYTYRLGARTNTGTLYIQPRSINILKFSTE